MSLVYADPSALVRAYFPNEPDHTELRTLLIESGHAVVTSEISRLEFACAVARKFRRAQSAGRDQVLARFAAHTGATGPISLIAFHPDRALSAAREIALAHELRALDAIHLAVAIGDGRRLADDELVFVTRDREQATAAAALGLTVR